MDGYAKIATLMGAYPEVAIIRRFAALNAQNILYLQAELHYLELRLRECEREDQNSGEREKTDRAVNWFKLRYSADERPMENLAADGTNPGDPPSKRWATVIEIRKKLKEYNEAVQQQVAFAQLQKPNPRDLRFLSEWLQRPDMGGVCLIGADSDIWSDPDHLDLAVLKHRHNESIFTALLSDRIIHSLHRAIFRITSCFRAPAPPADQESWRLDKIATITGTTYHSQTTILRIARVLAMTLASLLPVVSIVVLYFVHNMGRRLGIIGGFTAAFSIVLGIVTNGELVDVFAASAAFAAVQVVFVGTNYPSSQSQSQKSG